MDERRALAGKWFEMPVGWIAKFELTQTEETERALSNQIGRNTSWSAGGGYTRGTIGFSSDSSTRFHSYDAGARLTRAVTRHLGVFGDYSFYWYEVPTGSTVFVFLPKFRRQSVSFGVSVWAPIINDPRSVTPVR